MLSRFSHELQRRTISLLNHCHRFTNVMSTMKWKEQIRFQAYAIKDGISKGDFTIVQTLKARRLAATQLGDPADLEESTIKVIEQVKALEIAHAEGTQDTMGEFTDKVQELKGSPPDHTAWQDAIRKHADEMKAKFAKSVDTVVDKAMDKIATLDPAAQNVAAQVYMKAADAVAGVINTAIAQIGEVLNKVIDILKGIWEGVKEAYEVVSTGVATAVSFIKGLFSVNLTSKAKQFIGRLNWPAAVTIPTTADVLAYLCVNLANKGIEYTAQTYQLEEKDGKKIIATETTIRFTGLRAGPGDDLEAIWKECVQDLGTDGHWVPIEG